LLIYYTTATGLDPIAWLIAAANKSSKALFVENLTNVVVSEGFSVKFTAYTVFPFFACTVACFAALTIQFRSKIYLARKVLTTTSLYVRGALRDPVGALVGSILLGICLVIIIITSFFKIDIWMTTLHLAVAKLAFDITWDYYQEETEQWEKGALRLGIWRRILAWAQHKKEDLGKELEYGWDRLEALKEILRDIELGAKVAFIGSATDPNGVEQSINHSIEQEYDRLCQHTPSHTDDVGRILRCCVRKQLFKEMLEALPKLPPVCKQSEHRGLKTDTNHVADLTAQTEVGGVRFEIWLMEGDPCMGTAQDGGYWTGARMWAGSARGTGGDS
jgi:hypothetical protein